MTRPSLVRPLGSFWRTSRLWVVLPAVLVLVLVCAGTHALAAHAAPESPRPGQDAGDTASPLGTVDAIVLGVVEGVTEYLPVSSTGHLLVAQHLLGMTGDDDFTTAADSYAIAIQFGAILAVVILYRGRLMSIARGLAGRDREGRRLATALVASFAPAVVIALIGETFIKGYLFALWPIVAAWVVGGLVILLVARHDKQSGVGPEEGAQIEDLTVRKAFFIGLLQCIAMWPGVSRSLATILGGRLVGLSTVAAVEYSFLLGLVTLTAATVFEAISEGSAIVATFGLVTPLIGVLAAFVSAALAVKWMVSYLHTHTLAIFGWYRLGAGAVVAVLLLVNVI